MTYLQFVIAWTLQCLARIPEKIIIGARLNRTFEGQENLKEAARLKREHKAGVIFVMNHASHFDPIIFLAGINPFSNLAPMFYMTRKGREYKKETNLKWLSSLYGGFFFYAWGGIPTEPGSRDYESILTEHVKLLKRGRSLAIFPEGTVTRKTLRVEARGGAAYLAEASSAVIVPVYIDGLWYMTAKEFWARTRKVTVTFGKPFFLSDLEPQNKTDSAYFRQMSEKIMDRVYALADNSTAEMV